MTGAIVKKEENEVDVATKMVVVWTTGGVEMSMGTSSLSSGCPNETAAPCGATITRAVKFGPPS